MSKSLQTVTVDLGERSYPIHIGTGLLQRAGELLAEVLGENRRVLVVSDHQVASFYLEDLQVALREVGCQVSVALVAPGEPSKSVSHLTEIWEKAVNARLDRNSVILALGGGVVGDLAGFAAASFLRGVSFVQIPTSLLAMVDSSVGGKTGINLPQGKNLVGAFHQPALVLADLLLLGTLPAREFNSGMAEVIKYGVIRDAELFAMLEQERESIWNLDIEPLLEVVKRSCEIKADVVREDERESGIRAILNFGHTLGHAIENVSGYGRHLHGEAIAAGMVFAARLSEQVCGFSSSDTGRLMDLLDAFDLPRQMTDMTWESLFEVMTADKKAQNSIPRFVLADHIGQALLPREVPEEMLKDCFRTWRRIPA